jgi:hypothetical protein
LLARPEAQAQSVTMALYAYSTPTIERRGAQCVDIEDMEGMLAIGGEVGLAGDLSGRAYRCPNENFVVQTAFICSDLFKSDLVGDSL